jgi:dihydropteroate synthase
MFLQCGSQELNLTSPRIMGIVNVTPDSFSDGGFYFKPDAAIAHAEQLLEEGADILDIGGESTRPGAAPVGIQEELDRVIPVIEGLQGARALLSIDTRKPEVMRAALMRGVAMVNDIDALQNPQTLEIVAASGAAVCLMHKKGTPQTMQQAPQYENVVHEVKEFLRQRVDAAVAAGIDKSRIAIDPGFGFGKTLEHNLALLAHLREFHALGVPVLAGLSRKSMLGALTGQGPENRVNASVAAALIAVMNGANILRVHDAGAMRDALKIWNAVNDAQLQISG